MKLMATVEEILRNAGIGDEQVRALDPKTITAFGGVLSEAERVRQEARAAQEQAELAQRSYTDLYQNQIAPSLIQWDEERQRLENERAQIMAENAYYKAQAQGARDAGFIASDAPPFQSGYQQGRDSQGRYVAGAPGATPGSPTFDVNQVYQRAGDAINVLTDISWEHQRLFGQPLPVSPSELVKRADAQRMDPRTYAAREFHWEERRQEMQKKQQEDHDNQIRREVEQRKDREFAEKLGSNPDIRLAQSSRYSDAAKAVRAGTRVDPLTLNEADRQKATRMAIREDLAQEVR
jgi:hypothetical protein